jgi:phosphohistidine swiveling domain-containing protein
LRLPERLGEIVSVHKGRAQKTVIHIRDAHCDYSAQNSIAGIIAYCHDNYSIDLAALEGGAGRYDLSVFTDIKDASLRYKAADYFMKQGEVSGAEFYAINNPAAVKLYGIEDAALYLENLAAYRDSLEFRDEAIGRLKALDETVSAMKQKIYAPDMLALDKKMRLFKDEKISFEEYASAIAAIAKKNNMDLGKYPNIKKFYEVKDGEGAIRLKEAEKERNMLIDQLNKRLSKRYLEELVARTVAFNDGEISADEYYSYLLDKAKLCGIELDSMPDLAAYAKTAKGIKSIDKKALEKEFKALEDEMCGLFFRTQRERELCALDRRVYLLGRLFSASMSKDEWDRYRADSAGFIRDSAYFAQFENWRRDMEKFYALSLERDRVFAQKIAKLFKESGRKSVLLVTGGFHQDNLKRIFEDSGYTYVEILPKIEESKAANPYYSLLSGGADPIMQAVLESRSGLQIASYLSDKKLCPNADAFRTAVTIVEKLLSDGRAEAGGAQFSLFKEDGLPELEINGEKVVVDGHQVYASGLKAPPAKPAKKPPVAPKPVAPKPVAPKPVPTPTALTREELRARRLAEVAVEVRRSYSGKSLARIRQACEAARSAVDESTKTWFERARSEDLDENTKQALREELDILKMRLSTLEKMAEDMSKPAAPIPAPAAPLAAPGIRAAAVSELPVDISAVIEGKQNDEFVKGVAPAIMDPKNPGYFMRSTNSVILRTWVSLGGAIRLSADGQGFEYLNGDKNVEFEEVPGLSLFFGGAYIVHGYTEDGMFKIRGRPAADVINEIARKNELKAVLLIACNPDGGSMGAVDVPVVYSTGVVRILGKAEYASLGGWKTKLPSGKLVDGVDQHAIMGAMLGSLSATPAATAAKPAKYSVAQGAAGEAVPAAPQAPVPAAPAPEQTPAISRNMPDADFANAKRKENWTDDRADEFLKCSPEKILSLLSEKLAINLTADPKADVVTLKKRLKVGQIGMGALARLQKIIYDNTGEFLGSDVIMRMTISELEAKAGINVHVKTPAAPAAAVAPPQLELEPLSASGRNYSPSQNKMTFYLAGSGNSSDRILIDVERIESEEFEARISITYPSRPDIRAEEPITLVSGPDGEVTIGRGNISGMKDMPAISPRHVMFSMDRDGIINVTPLKRDGAEGPCEVFIERGKKPIQETAFERLNKEAVSTTDILKLARSLGIGNGDPLSEVFKAPDRAGEQAVRKAAEDRARWEGLLGKRHDIRKIYEMPDAEVQALIENDAAWFARQSSRISARLAEAVRSEVGRMVKEAEERHYAGVDPSEVRECEASDISRMEAARNKVRTFVSQIRKAREARLAALKAEAALHGLNVAAQGAGITEMIAAYETALYDYFIKDAVPNAETRAAVNAINNKAAELGLPEQMIAGIRKRIDALEDSAFNARDIDMSRLHGAGAPIPAPAPEAGLPADETSRVAIDRSRIGGAAPQAAPAPAAAPLPASAKPMPAAPAAPKPAPAVTPRVAPDGIRRNMPDTEYAEAIKAAFSEDKAREFSKSDPSKVVLILSEKVSAYALAFPQVTVAQLRSGQKVGQVGMGTVARLQKMIYDNTGEFLETDDIIRLNINDIEKKAGITVEIKTAAAKPVPIAPAAKPAPAPAVPAAPAPVPAPAAPVAPPAAAKPATPAPVPEPTLAAPLPSASPVTRDIADAYVKFIRENQNHRISRLSDFEKYLKNALPSATVQVVYIDNNMLEPDVYFESTEEVEVPSETWLVRIGGQAFLLPRPSTTDQFGNTHNFTQISEEGDIRPKQRFTIVPAVVSPVSGNAWKVQAPGSLSRHLSPSAAPTAATPAAAPRSGPGERMQARGVLTMIGVGFGAFMAASTPSPELGRVLATLIIGAAILVDLIYAGKVTKLFGVTPANVLRAPAQDRPSRISRIIGAGLLALGIGLVWQQSVPEPNPAPQSKVAVTRNDLTSAMREARDAAATGSRQARGIALHILWNAMEKAKKAVGEDDEAYKAAKKAFDDLKAAYDEMVPTEPVAAYITDEDIEYAAARLKDGKDAPLALIVEKLLRDLMQNGVVGDLEPEQDVISKLKSGAGFGFKLRFDSTNGKVTCQRAAVKALGALAAMARNGDKDAGDALVALSRHLAFVLAHERIHSLLMSARYEEKLGQIRETLLQDTAGRAVLTDVIKCLLLNRDYIDLFKGDGVEAKDWGDLDNAALAVLSNPVAARRAVDEFIAGQFLYEGIASPESMSAYPSMRARLLNEIFSGDDALLAGIPVTPIKDMKVREKIAEVVEAQPRAARAPPAAPAVLQVTPQAVPIAPPPVSRAGMRSKLGTLARICILALTVSLPAMAGQKAAERMMAPTAVTTISNDLARVTAAESLSLSVGTPKLLKSADTPEKIKANSKALEDFIRANKGLDLVVTPEYAFGFFNDDLYVEFSGTSNGYIIKDGTKEIKEAIGNAQALARRFKINIILGTMRERLQVEGRTVYLNSAVIIDSLGNITHIRRKVADISVGDNKPDREQLEDSIVKNICLPSAKPVQLTNRNNKPFTLFTIICYERNDQDVLKQIGSKVDMIVISAREGDNPYNRVMLGERPSLGALEDLNNHYKEENIGADAVFVTDSVGSGINAGLFNSELKPVKVFSYGTNGFSGNITVRGTIPAAPAAAPATRLFQHGLLFMAGLAAGAIIASCGFTGIGGAIAILAAIVDFKLADGLIEKLWGKSVRIERNLKIACSNKYDPHKRAAAVIKLADLGKTDDRAIDALVTVYKGQQDALPALSEIAITYMLPLLSAENPAASRALEEILPSSRVLTEKHIYDIAGYARAGSKSAMRLIEKLFPRLQKNITDGLKADFPAGASLSVFIIMASEGNEAAKLALKALVPELKWLVFQGSGRIKDDVITALGIVATYDQAAQKVLEDILYTTDNPPELKKQAIIQLAKTGSILNGSADKIEELKNRVLSETEPPESRRKALYALSILVSCLADPRIAIKASEDILSRLDAEQLLETAAPLSHHDYMRLIKSLAHKDSQIACGLLKNIYIFSKDIYLKNNILETLTEAAGAHSSAALKTIEELIPVMKKNISDYTVYNAIKTAALCGSRKGLSALKDLVLSDVVSMDIKIDAINQFALIANIDINAIKLPQAFTPEYRSEARNTLYEIFGLDKAAGAKDELLAEIFKFVDKHGYEAARCLAEIGQDAVPEEFIKGIFRNRDTPLLDALDDAKESNIPEEELRMIRSLVTLSDKDYRNRSQAIVLLVNTGIIIKIAGLDRADYLARAQECLKKYSDGGIGEKLFMSTLQDLFLKFSEKAVESMLGGISNDERAAFEKLSSKDQAFMAKLINLVEVYFRIKKDYPDTALKILKTVKQLLALKDAGLLNKWLYTQAPWNAKTYETLTGSGYSPDIWSKGFRKTVPSGSGNVDAKRRMRDQTWQLYEMAQKLKVRGLPERKEGEGFETYEEAEIFAQTYLLGNDRVPDDSKVNVRNIVTETRRLKDTLARSVEQATVTVEISQDFLMDAYSGVGVAGCFNPISGDHREMPLMHSLETDSLFLRVYDINGRMIANAVLILTEKGVVVQPLWESTGINLDLDGAVFDALAELVLKGIAPAVFMEKTSAGFSAAGPYLKSDPLNLPKARILKDEYYFDFGKVDGFATTHSFRRQELSSYKPLEAMKAVSEEQLAQKKAKATVADIKKEAQKELFALGTRDQAFKNINFVPLLQQLESIIFDLKLESVKEKIGQLLKRDGAAISSAEKEAVLDVIMKIRTKYAVMASTSKLAPAAPAPVSFKFQVVDHDIKEGPELGNIITGIMELQKKEYTDAEAMWDPEEIREVLTDPRSINIVITDTSGKIAGYILSSPFDTTRDKDSTLENSYLTGPANAALYVDDILIDPKYRNSSSLSLPKLLIRFRKEALMKNITTVFMHARVKNGLSAAMSSLGAVAIGAAEESDEYELGEKAQLMRFELLRTPAGATKNVASNMQAEAGQTLVSAPAAPKPAPAAPVAPAVLPAVVGTKSAMPAPAPVASPEAIRALLATYTVGYSPSENTFVPLSEQDIARVSKLSIDEKGGYVVLDGARSNIRKMMINGEPHYVIELGSIREGDLHPAPVPLSPSGFGYGASAQPAAPAAPVSVPGAGLVTVKGKILPDRPSVKRGVVRGAAWKNTAESFEAFAAPGRREYDRDFTEDEIQDAIDETVRQMEELKTETLRAEERAGYGDSQNVLGGIFDAHIMTMSDPEFMRMIKERISKGEKPARAILETGRHYNNLLLNMEDEYLRQRAPDTCDVTMRLVRNLVNPASHPEAVPKGKVAITDKLYPSDVIERYSNAKAIIVTGKDMAENGHAVFLAAGLGITLIAAPGLDANSVPDDTDISIDTDRGVIEFMPPAAPAAPVGNLIFDAGLSAADREKLIREGGRVLADGSIVPPRWTDWQNSIYRMNLSFRYIMNGDLTDRLIALKALAEQKRARGETLYILDWGAGDLTAAVELAELLKIHGITNFRIIATGDTYFRVMKQVPEEVTVVIGTAENLAGHLTRILNGGKIEAVYSNFGIRYLYARGNTDRFMEHIRSLLPHLSDGAFVVYSGYRRGSEDGAGYPNDIRAAGQLKEYFESVILEPSGDDRGNVLLLERLKRPAAAPVAPASVSALRPETAVPAPAVSAAAGMPIVKPELPGGTAGGVPVVEIASPRQTAAGLAMTGVEQQTAAGLAMTGVEQQTAAGSAMTQVAVLTVPAGAGMASYNEAAQTAKSDDTVARVGQTLSNTLAGNEYHIFVSGAVPTEDVTAQDETAAGSAAAELKNPVNDVQVAGKHLISDKLKLAASITHTIGLEKARDAIAGDAATSVKNLRETVAREAISYTISAHVLKALERDEALKAKLGMSVEKYLRENTLLDVVSDEADKKVYLMSYLQATNMALARLNLVKVLTNRKPEDIEKDEYCRAALKLYCDAVGLMSGWRSEEIEKFRAELVRAIAAGDQGPTGFFKNYNFSIILPPVAKINFSDMKSALAAMTQVLQSM